MMSATCFQLKASFSPCAILKFSRYDLLALEEQLAAAISQAPNFFLGSPIVLDLEKVNAVSGIDFSHIKQILMKNGLVPVGVRGGAPEQMEAARSVDLPMIAIGKTTTTEPKKTEEKVAKPDKPISAAKLVTHPMRGGMQIYAKDSDLIVVAQVSPGAELLADGHIHVYGPLRGRAMAGVQGNLDARIFCRTLEAELVSIAGYYLTQEDMQALPAYDGMIQIYLENEQVKIEVV